MTERKPVTTSQSRMRRFDPRKMGRYERQNWVAYYQKKWPSVFLISLRLVGEAFGLSWLDGVRGAYLVARAERAAAPDNNDTFTAEGYMRSFYEIVKRRNGESFDAKDAAELEVNWWKIHRQVFDKEDNAPLVDALARLYATTYGISEQEAHEAAYHRGQAMLYSDKWVYQGCPPRSLLLEKEEEELVLSYNALRAAVSASEATALVSAHAT